MATQLYGYAGSSFDTTGSKRRLQVTIDALGSRWTYSWNGRGQLLAAQNPLGGIVTHGYDGFGNRVSTTDPLGNVSTFAVDVAGNVLARVDPLGNRWSTSTPDPQLGAVRLVAAQG